LGGNPFLSMEVLVVLDDMYHLEQDGMVYQHCQELGGLVYQHCQELGGLVYLHCQELGGLVDLHCRVLDGLVDLHFRVLDGLVDLRCQVLGDLVEKNLRFRRFRVWVLDHAEPERLEPATLWPVEEQMR
jgi:hypothetical protein